MNYDEKERKIVIICAAVILIGLALISRGASVDSLLSTLLTIPGVIIAMTFHEFAHAFVADKLGDDTPRRQGRLNINPLSHIDPVGLALLLFAGFGWGKPVEINPANFKGKYSISKAEAIVAAAGPIMNFILAFVFMIITFVLFNATNIVSALGIKTATILNTIMSDIVMINIGLGVFNLIPLPPLDGSKVLMNFLGYKARNWFMENERNFYMVFVMLWVTGILSRIVTPVFSAVASGMYWVVFKIVSIFM